MPESVVEIIDFYCDHAEYFLYNPPFHLFAVLKDEETGEPTIADDLLVIVLCRRPSMRKTSSWWWSKKRSPITMI